MNNDDNKKETSTKLNLIIVGLYGPILSFTIVTFIILYMLTYKLNTALSVVEQKLEVYDLIMNNLNNTIGKIDVDGLNNLTRLNVEGLNNLIKNYYG